MTCEFMPLSMLKSSYYHPESFLKWTYFCETGSLQTASSATPAPDAFGSNGAGSCGAQCVPHLFRGRRHLDIRRADPCQRVVDGIHHRGDRGDRAGFADALDAERVFLGQGRVVGDVEVAKLVGSRHAIILEGSADELTGC